MMGRREKQAREAADAAREREAEAEALSGEAASPECEGVEIEDPIEVLQRERDEFESKYRRALADFQNYQRRAVQNEQEARLAGARSVVGSVVNVVDHFDLALQLDPAKTSAEQVIGGVRVIRDELFKALQTHGVSAIEPRVGEEFQPGRHEAVMQFAAEGVGAGCVSMVMQVGYAIGDRVLRPAKVAVAPAAAGEGDGEG